MSVFVVRESDSEFEQNRVYENCFFGCGNSAPYWSWRTNQAVCSSCAVKRQESELVPCVPDYKPREKLEWLKDGATEVIIVEGVLLDVGRIDKHIANLELFKKQYPEEFEYQAKKLINNE